MINSYSKIKSLLEFNSDDDFYFLQIIKRKKDNKLMKSDNRVIKNYYINSIEYLENELNTIIEICDLFNARAMIRLNKRSFKKVSYKSLEITSMYLNNGDYKSIKSSYSRACGLTNNDKNKKWVIDIDCIWYDCNYMENLINISNPIGDKIFTILDTKNGYHIITKPFDLRRFKNEYPEIDIHKDNPINLYIP